MKILIWCIGFSLEARVFEISPYQVLNNFPSATGLRRKAGVLSDAAKRVAAKKDTFLGPKLTA